MVVVHASFFYTQFDKYQNSDLALSFQYLGGLSRLFFHIQLGKHQNPLLLFPDFHDVF
jgi:hypothetical protein